ncbi:MAG: acyltransferase [Acidobacteriota bacterium]|nr:acyltransferase [Acidobacteriota bacterium]
MSDKNSSPIAANRLDYIDWMRGLACVLMIQAHCYDSWLTPEARKTLLYRWSQDASTLPAPIFLLLAGVSFVLVTERLQQKQIPANKIFKTALLRGAEILGFAFLLRIQEFVLGFPKCPWTDLFRVDVLNILGISLIFMAIFWRLAVMMSASAVTAGTQADNRTPALATQPQPSDGIRPSPKWRTPAILYSLIIAAIIALATPPLWTTHRPRFLPWMLESYINGVHIYNSPQPWLFAIFPWCAFAFVGLAFGLFIFSNFARPRQSLTLAIVGAIGALACGLSLLFDNSSVKLYAVYDYWHSSPNFFLMRAGLLLILLFAIYAWCRWGLATKGFSPFIQFGKTSLLVYWVHMEFVYGRLSILRKWKTGIPLATAGMIVIFAAMLALSIWRTRAKKRAAIKLQARTPAPSPVTTAI